MKGVKRKIPKLKWQVGLGTHGSVEARAPVFKMGLSPYLISKTNK